MRETFSEKIRQKQKELAREKKIEREVKILERDGTKNRQKF